AIRRARVGAPAPEPELPRRPAEVHEADRARRRAVDELALQIEPLDETLQQLVERTAREFDVPISLVTLVLEDRQWFKAHVGLAEPLRTERGTPRAWSFCQHVVESGQPMVVADAAIHPLFASNPLVRNGTVRSYAGAPLSTPDGQVLGTLCILDQRPMAIGADDIEKLVTLARRVAGELALRAPRSAGAPMLAPAARDPAALTGWLEAVLSHLDAGVVLDGPDRHALVVNRAVGTLFGVDPAGLIGLTRSALLAQLAESACDDPALMLRALEAPPEGPFAGVANVALQRPARRLVRWSSRPVPLEQGVGQLTLFTDITAEAELAAERERQASTDPLTGLLNRRGCDELLARELARTRRLGAPMSFVLFDIDHFKRVNDEHGHAAGNAVLADVARLLREQVRATDVPVRWGGEELLVVLPEIPADGARMFAERVRHAVAAHRADGLPNVTVSAGVAQLEPGEEPPVALVRADAALYEAKRSGRNRVL
ncbi:MAG: diguanylate cyclase, partial [Myxococcales bacterium]